MTIFYKILDKRISQNKNNLVIVCGETGSGKSFTALAIGEAIDPTFCVERVVFNVKDFIKLLNSKKLKKGSVIVFDEAGVGIPSRQWYSLSNKVINYILQTFRHENLSVIFTTPTFEFIDKQTRTLFHFYIETLKVKIAQQKVMAKVRQIQYNPRYQKTYVKRIIYGSEYIDPYHFPKPSDALVEAYEAKKVRFTRSLKRDVQAEIKEDEVKKKKKQALPISHYINIIKKNPKPFTKTRKNKEEYIDRAEIMVKFEELGTTKANLIKRKVEHDLKMK